MKYEMNIVHDKNLNEKLLKWTENDRLKGYTTFLVHMSYGLRQGPFQEDDFSGEKFFTTLFFEESEKETASEIKKMIENEEFFVVLKEIKEI